MFRLWAKIFKDNRMLRDLTICDDSREKNRTKKVFDALDEVCYTFDLRTFFRFLISENPVIGDNIKDITLIDLEELKHNLYVFLWMLYFQYHENIPYKMPAFLQ